MDCRSHCGACCTAPLITSPIPGMPDGKPAGLRCVQLVDEFCAVEVAANPAVEYNQEDWPEPDHPVQRSIQSYEHLISCERYPKRCSRSPSWLALWLRSAQ